MRSVEEIEKDCAENEEVLGAINRIKEKRKENPWEVLTSLFLGQLVPETEKDGISKDIKILLEEMQK